MGVIKFNERFKKLFANYLLIANRPSSTTYSGYNGYGGYSGSTNVTIYFYEWSNMKNGAKIYHSKEEFLDRCKKDNITITDEAKKFIERENWIWCTCIPGKAELMVDSQYYNLDRKLEAARKAYEAELKENKVLALPCPNDMDKKWEAARKAYEEGKQSTTPHHSEMYY
jgi:hypothetical protein